jgi:SAM-dependent methyltransferase
MATALVTNQAYEIFLHNASLAGKRVTVRPIRALSEGALPSFDDATFDIVYVDGCHYYREALFDMTEGRRLLKEGGILCGDDLELQPAECDLDTARRHLRTDYIRDPRSGRPYHPGVTLAIHELFGRVSSFSGFWAMRKQGGTFREVSFAGARGVMPTHWPGPFVDSIRAYFRRSTELGQLVE